MLRSSTRLAIAILVATARPAAAQTNSLADRIAAIVTREPFKHAVFGIKVASLDRDSVIFSLNADKLFVPGSTTKLLTTGTALELLGSDFRFHTKVYRTGPIGADGTLRGDLVLVASGDPNLSQRIQGDSLLFVDEDHSYGNDPATDLVAGDPLAALRDIAAQVKAKGVKRITGWVRVDPSLFSTGGTRELGSGVMIGPTVVNDNIIDLIVTPGAAPGKTALVKVQPDTRYLKVVNRVTTGDASAAPSVDVGTDTTGPGDTRIITLTGTLPAGGKATLVTYKPADPDRFAAHALRRALDDAGIPSGGAGVRRASPHGGDPADHLVADHVSPPFKEAAKVILKVSQNLHASMLPFTLGALKGKSPTAQAGFDLEHEFLTRAGLDISGAVQSDGAGGSALYTPDFMVSYLTYMSRQKSFPEFQHALPILGVDGTLAKISRGTPAAGHVFAKTGTFVSPDLLNQGLVVDGKGLAGYLTTRSGQRLVLAIYINRVKLTDPKQIGEVVGQAAGDVAAAVYDVIK